MTAPLTSTDLFHDYQITTGRYDECKDANGATRRPWLPVVKHLSALGIDGLNQIDNSINQLVRKNTITLNRMPTAAIDPFLDEAPTHPAQENETAIRPWRLSPIPMVIDHESWAGLERGLIERTQLLEAILQDLLGPQHLVREKVIPAALLWANPYYYRAYRNLAHGNHCRLQVSATDVVRAPDGQWWATGDRSRAPSGLGYLLENRIITSRTYPDLFRSCQAERLASFFDNLRNELQSIAPNSQSNPRVALLSPGENSFREFEDAYLARYLGFTLAQGSDLAVRNSKLHLKTLGGLLPVDVVLRHVSDRKCDPLELDPSSSEGVSGLLQSIRAGEVTIANAIGSTLAQMPGLIPFLQPAAEFLLGKRVSLPSVATYWCGLDEHRQYVLDHIDQLTLRNAFLVTGDPPIVPAELSAAAKQELLNELQANPLQYVAQERLALSTTPVWQNEQLEPRYVTLRCFQLQTNSGVQVLPGALSRLSETELGLNASPLSGQLTQDCWIESQVSSLESEKTLLPPQMAKIPITRTSDELPSRVAEHFFWLGRYAERGEAITRLLRTTLMNMYGEARYEELLQMPKLMASLAAAGQIETAYGVDGWEKSLPSVESILPSSLLDDSQPRGLLSSIQSMLSNATAVRDRLSLDAFRVLRRINLLTNNSEGQTPLSVGECIERLDQLVHYWLAFAGIISESTTRTHGWRVLELGRRIERSMQLSELLHSTLIDPIANESPVFESVLETTDSLMTYRSRYVSVLQTAPTIDLLVTDSTNPRSLNFQISEIARLLADLSTESRSAELGEEEKTAERLASALKLADVQTLASIDESGRRESLRKLLQANIDELPVLSNQIVAKYLIHSGNRMQISSMSVLPFPTH